MNNEAIRYFVVFADDGTRLFTLAADNMPHTVASILSEYPRAVEVSAEEQQKLILGWKRDPITGTLIGPVDTRDLSEAKDVRINEVNKYEAQVLASTADEVLECLENSQPVPQSTRDERMAIRTQANDFRQAILNAQDLTELDAIIVNNTQLSQQPQPSQQLQPSQPPQSSYIA